VKQIQILSQNLPALAIGAAIGAAIGFGQLTAFKDIALAPV
jgi:hypothetical protein